jgi:hypothetical protein
MTYYINNGNILATTTGRAAPRPTLLLAIPLE